MLQDQLQCVPLHPNKFCAHSYSYTYSFLAHIIKPKHSITQPSILFLAPGGSRVRIKVVDDETALEGESILITPSAQKYGCSSGNDEIVQLKLNHKRDLNVADKIGTKLNFLIYIQVLNCCISSRRVLKWATNNEKERSVEMQQKPTGTNKEILGTQGY